MEGIPLLRPPPFLVVVLLELRLRVVAPRPVPVVVPILLGGHLRLLPFRLARVEAQNVRVLLHLVRLVRLLRLLRVPVLPVAIDARKKAVHHDAPPDVAPSPHVMRGLYPTGTLLALPLSLLALLLFRLFSRGAREYLTPFMALLRMLPFAPAWSFIAHLAPPLRVHVAVAFPPIRARDLSGSRVLALPALRVPLLPSHTEKAALPLALPPPPVALTPRVPVPESLHDGLPLLLRRTMALPLIAGPDHLEGRTLRLVARLRGRVGLGRVAHLPPVQVHQVQAYRVN